MITAKTSSKGQIVIPEEIRAQHSIKRGDVFEFIQGDEPTLIVMRKVNKRRNEGLLEALRACPCPFDIPPRSREMYKPRTKI